MKHYILVCLIAISFCVSSQGTLKGMQSTTANWRLPGPLAIASSCSSRGENAIAPCLANGTGTFLHMQTQLHNPRILARSGHHQNLREVQPDPPQTHHESAEQILPASIYGLPQPLTAQLHPKILPLDPRVEHPRQRHGRYLLQTR